MKDKIIIFAIGLLIGAIISTGSIYFYTLANNNSGAESGMQMQGGTPPSGEMPSGEMPSNESTGNEQGFRPNGTPPEKPGENTQNNNQINS